jgi:hypothetical protein
VSFGKQFSEASLGFYLQTEAFLLGLFNIKEESTMILPNAGNCSPTDSLKSQKT